MTPSRYRRCQVQVQARAKDGVQSAIQPVSEASLVGRSWANVDSRNHQYANYPRRRCVISMWGSKSGPFPSSVSPAGPAEGSCPRQLQPRPMISFSRANHHACPSFSSHFRRDPPRGKSRTRSSASPPGLAQHSRWAMSGRTDLGPLNSCAEADPRSTDQAFFPPLLQ